LIQLGLANLPGMPRSEVISALNRYSAQLAERRDYVEARREAQLPLTVHVEAMFDLSLTMIEAELGWVKNFVKQLEEENEKS
jgi:hypothetical protein